MQPAVCIRVGGAGNKGIHLQDEHADYMLHVVEGIKSWDMCAVDALMKARFGLTSNKDRQKLTYENDEDDCTMHNGIIMARSEPIYELCYDRLQEYLRDLKVVKVECWSEAEMKMKDSPLDFVY